VYRVHRDGSVDVKQDITGTKHRDVSLTRVRWSGGKPPEAADEDKSSDPAKQATGKTGSSSSLADMLDGPSKRTDDGGDKKGKGKATAAGGATRGLASLLSAGTSAEIDAQKKATTMKKEGRSGGSPEAPSSSESSADSLDDMLIGDKPKKGKASRDGASSGLLGDLLSGAKPKASDSGSAGSRHGRGKSGSDSDALGSLLGGGDKGKDISRGANTSSSRRPLGGGRSNKGLLGDLLGEKSDKSDDGRDERGGRPPRSGRDRERESGRGRGAGG